MKKKLRKNTKQAEKSIQQRLDHYSDNVINSDDDLILNEIIGSDVEEESDKDITHIPSLRVTTRNWELVDTSQHIFSLK